MTTKKADRELEALQTIIEAFQAVPENRRLQVLQYIATRFELSFAPSSSPETRDRPIQAGTGGTSANQQAGLIAGETIDKFLARKKPKTNYQAIAALAYYLKHAESVHEFSMKEIEAANTRARRPRIGNLSQDMSDAERYSHFVTSGTTSGMKQITTLGEEVVEALPDQKLVRDITRTHKGKKRRRAQAKRQRAK